MKLFRQGIFHCAYAALLTTSGACMSGNDSQTAPGEVAGETQDLLSSKKHHKEKRKKKKHWDGCDPVKCESLELQVDSHKHPEDSAELERSIRVQIPQKLPALFWGSELEAELIFEEGDEQIICSYGAKSHKLGSALELMSCDNGAKASDTITMDSATLKLECAEWLFAKVHVKLHEAEPCGETETECDPADVDDGDPCTIDACDPDGGETHTAAADGTACDDGNVCNGHECCQAGKCVGAASGPIECGGDGNAVVFTTDFDGNALPSELSPGTAQLTPVAGFAGLGTDPRKFGGNFLRSPTAQRVTLQLSGLPPHDKLDLKFLFGAIDSLDGTGTPPAGEDFVVTVDDVVIFSESFANAREYQIQSYVPPAGVQLARRVQMGFHGGGEYRESAYDLGKDPAFAGIVHTASTATIHFEYIGPGAQNINDESWAIDNLEVSVSGVGACEDCGGEPPVLDDNNPCTSDSCDPVLGVRHEPVAVGTSCGDAGNACTGAPTCNAAGACVPGAALSCDDGNACNGSEQCDPQVGCVAGTPLDCDDGNACNGAESCVEGCGCSGGTAPELDDNNDCTIDACDPDTGVSHEPAPADTSCGPDSGCDGQGNCVEFS